MGGVNAKAEGNTELKIQFLLAILRPKPKGSATNVT
jgi:hypothetical protein